MRRDDTDRVGNEIDLDQWPSPAAAAVSLPVSGCVQYDKRPAVEVGNPVHSSPAAFAASAERSDPAVITREEQRAQSRRSGAAETRDTYGFLTRRDVAAIGPPLRGRIAIRRRMSARRVTRNQLRPLGRPENNDAQRAVTIEQGAGIRWERRPSTIGSRACGDRGGASEALHVLSTRPSDGGPNDSDRPFRHCSEMTDGPCILL